MALNVGMHVDASDGASVTVPNSVKGDILGGSPSKRRCVEQQSWTLRRLDCAFGAPAQSGLNTASIRPGAAFLIVGAPAGAAAAAGTDMTSLATLLAPMFEKLDLRLPCKVFVMTC
jgi:hypothetical protein